MIDDTEMAARVANLHRNFRAALSRELDRRPRPSGLHYRGYKAVLQRFELLSKSRDEAGSSRYRGRSTPTNCSRLALNNNGATRAFRRSPSSFS
jgi:hypothetical protein